MIKNIFLIFLFCICLISCKTIDGNTNLVEEDIEFEFLDFTFDIDKDKTVKNEQGFYNPVYNILFKFKNKNIFFNVDYTILDESDNILLEKENVKPTAYVRNARFVYFVQDEFEKIFLTNKLKYKLKIRLKDEIKEIEGDFINDSFPYIEEYKVGPVYTKFIDDKKNVLISAYVKLKNCREVDWIRLIPPSKKFYWDIPYSKTLKEITAESSIYEKGKNSIENGEYIIQINLGKYGIFQKSVEIIDIYKNETGANYGLPIALLIAEDKKNIRLEINSLKSVKEMEIRYFVRIGGKFQQIGKLGGLPPQKVVLKEDMKKNIIDMKGKKLKLIPEKDYYFKVYLYSEEINGIQYVSISKAYKIRFKEYKFLPF